MFRTDVDKALKFFFTPDTTDRVVRTTKDEKLGTGIDFVFEIGEIHGVAAIVEDKGIFDQLAPVIQHRRSKRIVHGRLEDDFVAGLGIGKHCEIERRDHARRKYNPVFLYFPSIAALHPCDEGLIVALGTAGIAIYRMRSAFLDCGYDFWRTCKIHISNPKRECIFAARRQTASIPFQAVCRCAVDNRIKVIVHNAIPCRQLLRFLQARLWGGRLPGWRCGRENPFGKSCHRLR